MPAGRPCCRMSQIRGWRRGMGGARGRLAKWRSAGIIFIVAAATGCGDPDPAIACPLVRGWRRGTGGARGQLSSAACLGAGTAWRHSDGIKERGRSGDGWMALAGASSASAWSWIPVVCSCSRASSLTWSARQLCCMALFELTMNCCNLRLDLSSTDESEGSEGLGRRARLWFSFGTCQMIDY